MKDNNGGTGGPWWAKLMLTVGAPMVLLAGILGMIPGVKSPLFDIQQSLAAHRVEARRMIEVYELTCRGVWRGDIEQQKNCERAARGILRDQETP